MSEEAKSNEGAKSMTGTARVTLDQQLIVYWERQAQRFDRLAAEARWGWAARNYARKADRSRSKAEVSRAREAARNRSGSGAVPLEGSSSRSDPSS
jgi:hypothetical protein